MLGYSWYVSLPDEYFTSPRSRFLTADNFVTKKLGEYFNIEIISPYLIHEIQEFSMNLNKKSYLVGERYPVPNDEIFGKYILRRAFPETTSQWRTKEPIEVGSGAQVIGKTHFADYFTDEEFTLRQREILKTYDIYLRSKEQLVYFETFKELFYADGRWKGMDRYPGGNVECPACHFDIRVVFKNYPDYQQDFCKVCGFWPTHKTEKNNRNENAERLLHELRCSIEKIKESIA